MKSSFGPVLFAAILAGIVSTAAVAAPPVEFPFFQEFQDLNPCTGQTITLTFTGTVRVTDFDDHFVARYAGTVVTSDGGLGHFRALQVSHGTEHVMTQHNYDMEAYANGQRVTFGFIFHTTVVDGEVTAEVDMLSLKCVGKPQ